MIVLHGLGDSMEGYRWLPPALDLPSMNYLLVNAPDGYYGGFSWFDIYENRSPGIKRSRELLFELLDDLRAKNFPTDETSVFGFSQGCLLTLELGFRYPHKFAGLIGISGWPHEPEKLLAEHSRVAKQQRFLVTHGTRDPLIPFDAVKAEIMRFKDAGFNIDWREFEKVHTIAGETELDIIRDFVVSGYK